MEGTRDVEEGLYEQDALSCICLEMLMDYLCHLNTLERLRSPICVDTALSKADGTLVCVAGAIACNVCRLNSKVLLQVAALLQTVLNWIMFECQQQQQGCKRYDDRVDVPIHVGRWKISDADSKLVMGVLIKRIVTSSISVVDVLRLRVEEFALTITARKLTYQYMDLEPLQQALQRLHASLEELIRHVGPLVSERK
jgi:hypothetical protein